MPLRKCPDCKNEVSDTAPTCPQCGYQFFGSDTTICPSCRRPTAKKVQGVFGAEIAALTILTLIGILPGLIYYFDVTRYPYCSDCKKRVRKPR